MEKKKKAPQAGKTAKLVPQEPTETNILTVRCYLDADGKIRAQAFMGPVETGELAIAILLARGFLDEVTANHFGSVE